MLLITEPSDLLSKAFKAYPGDPKGEKNLLRYRKSVGIRE
jgi:hypothetical protein